jgi:hypothetical protein
MGGWQNDETCNARSAGLVRNNGAIEFSLSEKTATRLNQRLKLLYTAFPSAS